MTITTVGELIARLEDYDPETPIMLAHQPSWPLAETLAGIVGPEDREMPSDDEVDPDEAAEPDTVWLVAGGHAWDRSPYAPGWVFEGADR